MFLKNKNIVFKIRRSKVTDYAALNTFNRHMVYYIIYNYDFSNIYESTEMTPFILIFF